MKINFKETACFAPTKWFELHLDSFPMDIYYPPPGIIDHLTSNEPCCYGIDLEAEVVREIAQSLIDQFDINVDVFGGIFAARTRLEIVLAISEITERLHEKLKNV